MRQVGHIWQMIEEHKLFVIEFEKYDFKVRRISAFGAVCLLFNIGTLHPLKRCRITREKVSE